MASSLSPECTPLKVTYDTCFNAWFEGYLEPAVAAQPAERAAHSKAKAEEYEAKCGGLWKEYKTCIDKAIQERGLGDMLAQARQEQPLNAQPTRKS